MRERLSIVLAVFLFIAILRCPRVRAEEAPPKMLDPLVVSASHLPSTLDRTSASTTVITRDEIEARQAVSVVDLLRQVVGLHIDQAGGRGGVSSIYMRGGDPNFTVVMIDGVKVNDPTNSRGGSFDVSTLDPESIERIEIVRGPGSAVHGSDAMSGVINIITRSGTAKAVSVVDLGGGTEGDTRAGFETRGPLGAADYALNLSYVDEGSAIEGSGFSGTNIDGKLRLGPSHNQSLELVTRYGGSERSTFPEESGGPKFAVLRALDEREASEWTVGASYAHHLSERFEYHLITSYYRRQEMLRSPGVAPGLRDPFGIPPNDTDNLLNRTHVSIHSILSPFISTRIRLGAEAQFEKGGSEGSLLLSGTPLPTSFDLDRELYSVFLEAEWETPLGFTLEVGARRDEAEGFHSEVSPRAGFIYPIEATQTTLKMNWGEGFKLPSFFALGNGIVGNAALAPETSRSFELGLSQSFMSTRIKVTATYFNNRFFHLIDFDEGPPPILVNRSEVSTEGGELTFGLQSQDWLWINSHLTYTQTDIRGTPEELRNRPEWRAGIQVGGPSRAKVLSHLNILYVGKSLDASIPTGDRTLDDSIRVDLSARWPFRPHWELRFALDNVFDVAYEEAVGFPAPGIRGRIGLRFEI